MSRGNTIFIIITALLSINQTLVSGIAFFKLQKYHVYVLNGLQPSGDKVVVHCKSKDDDLGIHELALNEQFQWELKTSALDSTLFFCGLTWSHGQKVFDAFKDNAAFLDLGCGGRHCTWKAQEDGIYLFNLHDKTFHLLYQWDVRTNVYNSSMTKEIA